MVEWSARVDLAVVLSDERAVDLAEELAARGAAVLVQEGERTTSSVQLSVDADSLLDAVAEAVSVVSAAVGGDDVAVVGAAVMADVDLEQQLRIGPAPMELITSEEAAAILGLTRQRVEMMADQLEDFPPPAAVIGPRRRRGWWRPAIERYARYRQEHHPGRVPGSREARDVQQ